jgi:hypothetical protein
MTEASKKSNTIRILKDIGAGLLIFIGIVVLMIVLAVVGTNYFESPFDTTGGTIFIIFYMILVIIPFGVMPILILVLLMIDIIRIINDKELKFWYQRWYRILAVSALFFFMIMVSAIFLALPHSNQTGLDHLNLISPALAADDIPVNKEDILQNIRKWFIVAAITLLGIVFMLSGYVTLFIDETENNKRRVGVASDIFKLILGAFLGSITTLLKMGT